MKKRGENGRIRRIIQAGVGGMGQGWTDRVAESARWEAAAYVDLSEGALLSAADRHGMPKTRCYTDLKRCLTEVEAEAVLDVTPQKFRKSVCLNAFEKGLHVLSEKPLADSLKNARLLVDAAAQAKRTFMVAQNYRYQAITQTVKHLLSQGKLGEVGYVGINFHKGPRFGGFRETMPYPLVLDMAIHHIDMLRCILDTDIATVQAKSIHAPWNWNQGEATIMAQLETSTGVTANYFGSWVAAGWETGWNADWRIEGSKGVLLWEADELYLSNKPGTRKKVPLRKWPVEHQAHLIDLFAEYLDTGEEPETSGRQNLNSLASTYAIVKAAETGRRVRVGDLLK